MSDFTRHTFVTTRRLTIRYILALGILGLFLGLGNILLQRYITHQKNHALRINMAGRQRMLSQRIAHMVHHLAEIIEVDDQKKTQMELLELVNLMARSHQAFITGDVDGKVLPPNPPAVQKLYFESPANLDQKIKIYLGQAGRLAKLPAEQFPIDDSLLYSFHPFEITTLLGLLEAVTGEYEKASDDSISRLIFLENLLLLGTIAVLIFVALVIFRPMVRRIQFEVLELRKLSIVVEQSPVSVVITDLDGIIEYVNQKFTQVTGYAAEEAVGQNPSFVKSGVQPEEFYRELWETITAGREWHGEFCNKKKNGDIYWESASISPIKNSSGEIANFLAVKEDITERKQAEKVRARLSAQLEAKNNELEQIIYVVSHDLRSPLVNIDGYGKELEHTIEDLRSAFDSDNAPTEALGAVAPLLAHDIPDALRFIRTSASKMDALLAGLLKLSRSGRAALMIDSLDMNELIAKVVDACKFQIKEAGAELNLAELPPCKGDAVQVNQVFSNLLGNALQYLDSGRPGVIRISGRVEGGRSVYCVEDNGIGIAPEYRQTIFEIFHRLDPAKSKGEGLGLTIVQQVLGRLLGDIWVESKPGEGSRFYVALPAVQ